MKEVEQELTTLAALIEDMAAELIAAVKPWRDRDEAEEPAQVA